MKGCKLNDLEVKEMSFQVAPVTSEVSPDPELHALTTISALLAELSDDSRGRIVNWISSKFGVQGNWSVIKPDAGSMESVKEFSDLATLFVAASPATGAEKALTVAYWVQEYLHNEEWEGFAINTELKHLGHGLKNITDALNALIDQRPQLAVQLRKSGKTKQARKRYKLTVEGLRKVRQMVSSSIEP
jgi:hypothetical protein